MHEQLHTRLIPLEWRLIDLSAGSDYGYPARLATAPYTGPSQKCHALGVWLTCFEQVLAKKAGNLMPKANENGKFEFKGFVNIRLSEEHKQAIGALGGNLAQSMQELCGLIYTGYKVAIAYDRFSGAIQVTLTCQDVASTNYGYAISSRHPDIATAIASVLFKHFDIADGVWSSVADTPTGSMWD